MTFDRLPPAGPCTDPDGHDLVDIRTLASPIRVTVVCRRCGRPGTVVTFADSEPA